MEPVQPCGKAAPVGNDPVAGRPTGGLQAATIPACQPGAQVDTPALRKRRERSDEDVISPEISSQLLDERKKTKSNEMNTSEIENRAPLNQQIKSMEECCVFCERKDSVNVMVKCHMCDDFYHLACCGIPAKKHEMALEMIKILGWTCQDCRIDNRKFKIKMQEEISNLQLQLDALLARNLAADENHAVGASSAVSIPARPKPPDSNSSSLNVLVERRDESNEGKMTYSDVLKVVSKAVTDCTRRKKNIIITGLSEDESMADIDLVTELLGSVLHARIREKIVMMRRLGKTTTSSDQPRKLLVSLESEEIATDILNRAYLLKDTRDLQTNAKIFINRDLTPEESKLAFERRQQRREEKTDSTRTNYEAGDRERGFKVYYRSAGKSSQHYASSQRAVSQFSSRGGAYHYHGESSRGGVNWWNERNGEPIRRESNGEEMRGEVSGGKASRGGVNRGEASTETNSKGAKEPLPPPGGMRGVESRQDEANIGEDMLVEASGEGVTSEEGRGDGNHGEGTQMEGANALAQAPANGEAGVTGEKDSGEEGERGEGNEGEGRAIT